jgi:hypothetical protein
MIKKVNENDLQVLYCFWGFKKVHCLYGKYRFKIQIENRKLEKLLYFNFSKSKSFKNPTKITLKQGKTGVKLLQILGACRYALCLRKVIIG